MPPHQRVVVLLTTISLMILIFELVRKRRLREEYSWVWLLTACAVFLLAWMPQQALLAIAQFFGSENPPAAIFFMGFCLVALLCLQFSVRLSRMTEQVKTLAQKIALLEQDIERERAEAARREREGVPQ